MKKTNDLNSPLAKNRTTPSKINSREIRQDCFSSVNGDLSFYNLKSLSRTPMLENITISGVLREDGTVLIYFNEDEVMDMPVEIKENLNYTYGLGFMLFPDSLFFKGSIMDGFKYDHLSEEISTCIVNGNIIPFSNNQRASSIGKLKRIEDIIHLKSSLTITYRNNKLIKTKMPSKRLCLGIDISMQFKQAIA